MSRNVIYGVGKIRVWYSDGEVHFEIADGCRRLETFLWARDEMPHFLQVLLDIYNFFLSEYMEKLNEKREELNKMLVSVLERIEVEKKKHNRVYVEDLEKRKSKLGEEIDKVNETEKIVKDLSSELKRVKEWIITFKESAYRVWLGREW